MPASAPDLPARRTNSLGSFPSVSVMRNPWCSLPGPRDDGFHPNRSSPKPCETCTMTYRLGLLDKSLLAPGDTAEQALARTVDFARRAEVLGYHRFWVAEHHGFPGLASPAPELLAAFILARTKRIRVGSGGVLLQHYSPYKVAEGFNLLASLCPRSEEH